MHRLARVTILFLAALVPSVLSSPELAAQAPPASIGTLEHPARVSGGVMAGLLLDHKDPVYPEDARAKHIAGSIVFHAIISPEGKVHDLVVVSGPEALRDAATTAVRDWTYKPFQLNGRPVFVETTVTVSFIPQP